MKKLCKTPAVPTIHDKRMKRITPKIFCIHGRYTPTNVPSLATFIQIKDRFDIQKLNKGKFYDTPLSISTIKNKITDDDIN